MFYDETKGSPIGAFFTENLELLDLACTLDLTKDYYYWALK